MTGYGEAEGRIGGIDYAVEIKSVNNRYLRTSIKLPEPLAFLEEDIDRLLRQRLSRGSINYVLRIRGATVNNLFDIDTEGLRSITGQLEHIRTSEKVNAAIDLATLLSLPGIIKPKEPDAEMTDLTKEGVQTLSEQAIIQLDKMRCAEGEYLNHDLQSHSNHIRQELEQIHTRRSVVVQEYAEKLRKRVDSLLAEAKLNLDEETLAREVAVFAERSDITEEIARLQSHLQQFDQARESEDHQVGRRLDFICQEMLREANTIASKAADVDICQRVVNMKCSIDRIKEQIQNIE
jgi:uncharacterized protein (TIGR00255 family)